MGNDRFSADQPFPAKPRNLYVENVPRENELRSTVTLHMIETKRTVLEASRGEMNPRERKNVYAIETRDTAKE